MTAYTAEQGGAAAGLFAMTMNMFEVMNPATGRLLRTRLTAVACPTMGSPETWHWCGQQPLGMYEFNQVRPSTAR
jgi:hypothetical protein